MVDVTGWMMYAGLEQVIEGFGVPILHFAELLFFAAGIAESNAKNVFLMIQ